MLPVPPPGALGREMAACGALGAVLGAARGLFPVRGPRAFLPDMALVGALLLGTQSYAAGASCAGVLRWYMLAAAFAGAAGARSLVGPPVQWLEGRLLWLLGLPFRLLGHRVVQPLARRHRAGREERKLRRNAKRTAKNQKKSLPNQHPLLYNSYVSK